MLKWNSKISYSFGPILLVTESAKTNKKYYFIIYVSNKKLLSTDVLIFQSMVLLQTGEELNRRALDSNQVIVTGGYQKGVKQLQGSELQHTMRERKDLLDSYICLHYQPHKVTDYNIEHLAYDQKVVGFSSHSQNSGDIIGMSLHTRCKTKVGLVVFISYRGNCLKDFEKHLKSQLEYMYQNNLNEKQGFHIYIGFSTDFPSIKVLKMCFDIGLAPGIRDISTIFALRDHEIQKIITCPDKKARL